MSEPIKYPDDVKQKIETTLKAKDRDYKPRTRHLDNGQAIYTNRLILEDSPYLLQHAHNPVNWYPWGEAAFAAAKAENKPVFLSIGYATCHWCHVMEEESFENIEIADFLNKNFISIKVDREQYPDVDETYMTSVMLMTGAGGWPMTSFLLADGRPFFGGTYYPPAQFANLLERIQTAWQTRQAEVLEQAEKLARGVQEVTAGQQQVRELGKTSIQQAAEAILSRYDEDFGGFSVAPKFPHEPSLLLLLQLTARGSDGVTPELHERLQHTLSAMAQGGIYDQIGGGFHRYSTDQQWLVPHFEKMLYNQAYLARIYAQAWQVYRDPFYARISQQTLDYVLREMTDSSGGFYSATDADSEGEEGTFFIWSVEEIRQVLSREDADLAIKLYGVTEQGNFEGKNILHLPDSLAKIAQQEKTSLSSLYQRLDRINNQLREFRIKRIPPLTDNKVIVAWNSMLITTLAEVGDIFADQRYINAAIKAAEFIWQQQRVKPGLLWRVNLDGKPSIDGRQDDYALFADALVALYDLTTDEKWLKRAREITDEMVEKFYDKQHGGFFMSTEQLLFAQPKESYDNTSPSGNSIAVRLFNRLKKRTGEFSYAKYARETLQAFSGNISGQPSSYAYMVAQLEEDRNGEIGRHQYAGNGAIRIVADVSTVEENRHRLEIDFSIKEGWHINAAEPLHEDLIATSIKAGKNNYWRILEVNYPEALLKTLDFEEKPLALYEGDVRIIVELEPADQKPGLVEVATTLQTCNQESCLPPETISLWFKQPVSPFDYE